jgi:hypothetical protein
MKYTNDRLLDLVFENQKLISDQVLKNTEAFNGVKDALNNINDQNVLHMNKDDARAEVIKKLVDGNEKFYKIVTYIILISISALVILAGAEKALKFIPLP